MQLNTTQATQLQNEFRSISQSGVYWQTVNYLPPPLLLLTHPLFQILSAHVVIGCWINLVGWPGVGKAIANRGGGWAGAARGGVAGGDGGGGGEQAAAHWLQFLQWSPLREAFLPPFIGLSQKSYFKMFELFYNMKCVCSKWIFCL